MASCDESDAPHDDRRRSSGLKIYMDKGHPRSPRSPRHQRSVSPPIQIDELPSPPEMYKSLPTMHLHSAPTNSANNQPQPHLKVSIQPPPQHASPRGQQSPPYRNEGVRLSSTSDHQQQSSPRRSSSRDRDGDDVLFEANDRRFEETSAAQLPKVKELRMKFGGDAGSNVQRVSSTHLSSVKFCSC